MTGLDVVRHDRRSIAVVLSMMRWDDGGIVSSCLIIVSSSPDAGLTWPCLAWSSTDEACLFSGTQPHHPPPQFTGMTSMEGRVPCNPPCPQRDWRGVEGSSAAEMDATAGSGRPRAAGGGRLVQVRCSVVAQVN